MKKELTCVMLILLFLTGTSIVGASSRPAWANVGIFLEYGWGMHEYFPEDEVNSKIEDFKSNTGELELYGGSQSIWNFSLIEAYEDKGIFDVTVIPWNDGQEMTGKLEVYWVGAVYMDNYEIGLTKYWLYCPPEELEGNKIVDLPTALGTLPAYESTTESSSGDYVQTIITVSYTHLTLPTN